MKSEIIKQLNILLNLCDEEFQISDCTSAYRDNVYALTNVTLEAIEAFKRTPQTYDEPIASVHFENEISVDFIDECMEEMK